MQWSNRAMSSWLIENTSVEVKNVQENYKPIGDYIRVVNLKNRDLAVKQLIGLSIDKCYIPSVANVIGTDLSTYKIIKRNQFACSLMQVSRDEKIPIACMMEYDEAIMSPAYVIFEIIDESALMPEYLNMWVMRAEFDREASFLAVGGVRGSLAWDDFCRMKLPVPSIDEQRKIVKAYQTITDRIKLKKQINDNLEAQLRAYFAHFISDDEFSHLGKLKDVCSMQYGYTETATLDNVGPKFLRITDIAQSYIDWNTVPYCKISDQDYNKYVLREGDVVVARTGATVGASKMMYGRIPDSVFASFLVRIKPLDEEYKYYFGLAITSSDFLDFVQTNAGGSAQPQANPPLLGEYELPIPSKGRLKDFNSVVLNFLATMETNEIEISKLKDLQKTLLYTMSRR